MSPGSPSAPDAALVDAGREVEQPFAIRARSLSKTFRIPHEVRSTVRSYVLHPFRRTTYETQTALSDISFEIAEGEFFGIIGRNGSGKSTLLKVLAGIYQPDTGAVQIRGKLSPFIELGVGFNPELSARDNIYINGTLLGLAPRDIAARFDDIVEFGELERFVDQKLKNFSSGMQLRLAYSIAIQVPFDILLLDEVLAVGDQNFQEKCFATFEEMRRGGKTVVLVTHDLRAVSRFCDRSLLLRDGEVQALGTPDEVARLYLEQERERAGARPEPGRAPTKSERAGTGADEAETREQAMRHLERRWHQLAAEDLGLMSRGEVFEIVKTQQQHLEDRRKQLDRLLEELRDARADVEQLTMMVRVLVAHHHGDLPLPPPHLRFGKRPTELNFLAQGVAAADKALRTFGAEPAGLVLEWGCNAGRTYRWLEAYPRWREHYRGCDTDAEAVQWLADNLGAEATVCGSEPPLPYADRSLSGVLSLSMLTSIDPSRHRDWYRELHRIVEPLGRALLGAQGPSLARSRYTDAGEPLEDVFERDGWAFLPGIGGRGAAFVGEDFTRRAIDGLFELEAYGPQGHGSTDTYLLRRLG